VLIFPASASCPRPLGVTILRSISSNERAHAEIASVYANTARILAELHAVGRDRGTWLVPCPYQQGAFAASSWQPLEECNAACDISAGGPSTAVRRNRSSISTTCCPLGGVRGTQAQNLGAPWRC
jgi:hypothetical protein